MATVLVAYATRHGATAGIAERLAETLTQCGHRATALPVEKVDAVTPYDAVILGAGAYMFHWLKDAVRFAHAHADELTARPLWLFSSGPLGKEQVDDKGVNVLDAARPREFDELVRLLRPRGERVFFGAYDPEAKPVGLGETLMRHLPAGRDAVPPGDFRDWAAIEGWAREIAAALPLQ